MAKRKRNTLPFWRLLFVIYAGAMLWLLFGRATGYAEGIPYREQMQSNINIVPLHTIKSYWNVITNHPDWGIYPHCLINLFGNVLMFIPAGWLLPKIFKALRPFFRFFFTAFLCILLVEIVQLVTLLGSFDIDDIILNLTGMLIGWLVYRIFCRK